MPLETVLEAVCERFDRSSGDARRLFHGRGGFYPGWESVSVDWFPPVAVLTLHDSTAEAVLQDLATGLSAVFGAHLACLLVQRRHLSGAPWQVLHGDVPATAHATEAGLRYRLRLGSAQNVGFFLDMERGRALVRGLAAGRRVLNLFAYTCSFSVAAVAGGARQVVNLDMNRNAMDLGRQNHRDNDLDLRRASFLVHDLFKSFGKLRRLGPYDLAVIDPPSHQGASFSARRDWPRVTRQLPTLLAPGGDIVACLNSPHLTAAFLEEVFAEHLPGASRVARLPPPSDFADRQPERGLKVLHFRWQGQGGPDPQSGCTG